MNAVEIERYIGACLISLQNPVKLEGGTKVGSASDCMYPRKFLTSVYSTSYANINSYYSLQRCNTMEGWAGGMPLISFINQRRGRHPENPGNMRLKSEDHWRKNAVVRFGANNSAHLMSPDHVVGIRKGMSPKVAQSSHDKVFENKHQSVSTVDAASVTSDDSFGSVNSENCLPRVIKPRKRRKKDRKLPRPVSTEHFFTNPGAEKLKPNFTLKSYEPFGSESTILQEINAIKQEQCHVEELEASRLHDQQAVEETSDLANKLPDSDCNTCQCRYCDPSGLVWNMDRSYFSPVLTAPSCSVLETRDGNSVPKMTYCLTQGFSTLNINENNVMQRTSAYQTRSDNLNSGDLQVSTEIVTSANGHRDLEIKFYSSSSTEMC